MPLPVNFGQLEWGHLPYHQSKALEIDDDLVGILWIFKCSAIYAAALVLLF